MTASKLWIVPKLSMEEATVVLACLDEVNITDAKSVQDHIFAELSRLYEKRWPEQYQNHIRRGTFRDWREMIVDRMTPDELREAALATVDRPALPPDERDR